MTYSAQAIAFTPNLPSARAARARALIAIGDYEKAWDELERLEELGSRRNRIRDGLEKLNLYQVRFEYNLQRKRFDYCKTDIENMNRLDSQQAKSMKMEMVHEIATSGAKIDAALTAWLKV